MTNKMFRWKSRTAQQHTNIKIHKHWFLLKNGEEVTGRALTIPDL
jgi:hypothetical protein